MDIKKNALLVILGVGVVAITVAFAAFSSNLIINGTASVPDVSWNIHFQNWTNNTLGTANGHTNTAVYPQVSQLTQSISVANSTKVEGINVTLNQPGDYVSYKFQIINEGSIDASLSNFSHNLTCASGNDCSHLSYEVECTDNENGGNNVLVTNSTLAKDGGLAYCTLTVTYTDTINQNSGNAGSNQVYEKSAASATLDATWVYIQKVDSNSGSGSNSGNEQGGGEQSGGQEQQEDVPSNPEMFTFSDSLITGFNPEYFTETGEDQPGAIVIPLTHQGTTITGIRDGAFYGQNLTSVKFKSNISSIGSGSFGGNQLTTVTIPSTVTTMGYSAFTSNALTSAVIKCNVQIFNDKGAFSNNPNLHTLTFDYSTVRGTDLNFFSDLTVNTLILGNDVETIENGAFYNKTIPTVVINSGAIGNRAFEGATISSLTLNNGVTSIGDQAFESSSITSVNVPNSVTSIGDYAFEGSALTTATIGTGVQSIGYMAFANTSNLTTIVNNSGNSFNWCSIFGITGDNCTFTTGTINGVTITN